MHPYLHAKNSPDKPAIIMAPSGKVITYGELDRRSNQCTHLMRSAGLGVGDVVAVMLGNDAEYFELAWAAQRAGLYFVGMSSRLKASEVEYILGDSGAKVFISSRVVADFAGLVEAPPHGVSLFLLDEATGSYRNWNAERREQSVGPIADERAGIDMLYSSGTTGRPKGVRSPLPENQDIAGMPALAEMAKGLFGFTENAKYLCPAPLYHAAPLRWSMATQRIGGTVIVMERYDAELALELIEHYQITHSQWVPTHFVRMLKLPEEDRARYDVSSLKVAIHAAAPCPVPVKNAMIEWWGPVLYEYYAGTEGNGMTMIDSENWLKKPGSVGKPVMGIVHILDDDGNELGVNQEGQIYYEGGAKFEYHNDPEKTAEAHNDKGWSTLGDVGKLDEDGYLYLTDRKSFMIISGGVNIYPQEVENLLVTHPKVADVAVIGAPDPEMGEKVVAVLQPLHMTDATPEFAEEVMAWLKPQLSGVKMPRQIDFLKELPRHATGKFYKRLLRDEYWKKADALGDVAR